MLTIYSICRASASHSVEFPSVLSPGGIWALACGGAELSQGTDYLITGQVFPTAGGLVLGIEKALPIAGKGIPYFMQVFGKQEAGEFSGKLELPGDGYFSGRVFALDGIRMLATDLHQTDASSREFTSPVSVRPPSPASQMPALVTQRDLQPSSACPSGGEGGASDFPPLQPARQEPPQQPEEDPKVAPPALPASQPSEAPSSPERAAVSPPPAPHAPSEEPVAPEKPVVPDGVSSSSPPEGEPQPFSGDAGDGPSDKMVVKSVGGEAFPSSGKFPELSDVKRTELARKAEARKKAPPATPAKREASVVPPVSSGGIRLGKDSGGDKKPAVVQNKIDESELW